MPVDEEQTDRPLMKRDVTVRGVIGACLLTLVLGAIIPMVTIFVVSSTVDDGVNDNCVQIEQIKTRIRTTIKAADPTDPQAVASNPQLAEQVKAMTDDQKKQQHEAVVKVLQQFGANEC